MKTAITSILLLTALIEYPTAHAGKVGDFFEWLATDSLVDGFDYFADVSLGFRDGPITSCRKMLQRKRDEKAALQLFALALEIGLQNNQKKKAAYSEAKDEFLLALPSQTRALAAYHLKNVLASGNSDAEDLKAFRSLISSNFSSLTGEAYRKLGTLMIRRSDFFNHASDVDRVFTLIIQNTSDRQLSSQDIAILQIEMIQITDSYKTSGDVLETFEIIFGGWSTTLTFEDFETVGYAAAKVIQTFGSKSAQNNALDLLRNYAQILKAR